MAADARRAGRRPDGDVPAAPRGWPRNGSFEPERTALLVIGMKGAGTSGGRAATNLRKLLDVVRAQPGFTIAFFRDGADPQRTWTGECAPQESDWIVDVAGPGAFDGTEFNERLRRRGITSLIFAGRTTEGLIAAAMREAVGRGYECLLVEDCAASDDVASHVAALRSIAAARDGALGAVTSSDKLIGAVLRLQLQARYRPIEGGT